MKEICEYCEQMVDDYLLANHKKFFHAEELEKLLKPSKLFCDICGDEFESDASFSRHRSIHFASSIPAYNCDECGKCFDSQAKLSIHLKIHEENQEDDQNELYQCEICWEVLYAESKYSDHMLKHFGLVNRPNDCPLCPPGTKAKELHILRTHTEIYRKMRKYPCSLCDRRFFQESRVLQHIECIHNQNGPFLCPECGSGFHNHATCQEHRSFHLNYEIKRRVDLKKNAHIPKYTSCPICGKTYADKKKRHIFIQHHIDFVHNNIKNFPCTICEKSFATPKHLKRHTARHFKKEQCSVCRTRVENIKEHYEQIHPELKFICQLCFKGFSAQYCLKKHIASTHTDKRDYMCDLCATAYADKSSIRKHMKIHFGGKMTKGRTKVIRMPRSGEQNSLYVESD